MKEKKIALIIGGGASFGCYEAGVVTELLYALEVINRSAARARYILDIIVGASAGALVGALAAKITMHNYKEFKNILHEAWVKKADIDFLIDGKETKESFFSNHHHFKMIDTLFLGEKNIPICPSSFSPKEMLFKVSLSNLVGTDYDHPYKNRKDAFTKTFFSDYAEFNIGSKDASSFGLWICLAKAALASSSVPFLFPPVFLKRERHHYHGAATESLRFLPEEMGFVDGGLFNNEPIEEAIKVAKKADGKTDEDRIFLLVHKTQNSSQDLTFTTKQPFSKLAKRIFQMMVSEPTNYSLFSKTEQLKKEGISLYAIAEKEEKAIGRNFFGFLGLFEEKWRESDFCLGRRDAYYSLPEILGIESYPRDREGDYFSYIKKGERLGMKDVSLAKKEKFFKFLIKKIDLYLKEVFGVKGVFGVFINRCIKKNLAMAIDCPTFRWWNITTWL